MNLLHQLGQHPIGDRLLVRLWRYSVFRRLLAPLGNRHEPETWVFIMGCYNSGTTLLQSLLGQHAQIAVLPREGVLYSPLLTTPEELGYTRMWAACPEHLLLPATQTPEKKRMLLRDWLPLFDENRSVFAEKSISNVPRMGWFDRNFPKARFIGIRRNPYAVSEGIVRKARPTGAVRGLYPDGYPLHMAARQWRVANEALDLGASQVRYYTEVRYEDLAERPVDVLREILGFLQMDDGQVKAAEGGVSINGRFNPVRNMNASSFARLGRDDFAEINAEIAAAAGQWGYERQDD